MDYIVVGTSRCEYQAWQIKLLYWSMKKVKQKGKLVVLLSGDEGHKNENPDFNIGPDVTVIPQPDWAHKWQVENNDWWGGIPNKYKAIEWLCEANYFNDSDRLLFLDPDMIFTKPVDISVKEGEIVGQKFIDYRPLNGYEEKAEGDQLMYPFAIQFKSLKDIYKSYTRYCESLRKETGKWEAEMWGLDFAIFDAKLKVTAIEDLGTCTAWNTSGRNIIGDLIHYPNKIEDSEKNTLFFKQDYTFNQKAPIELSKTLNKTDNTLLTFVDQHRTDFLYHLKWDFTDIFKFYTGEKGNLVFKPWPGGFNNIRMSLELALCLAYLTNRRLVLPPSYRMYLLEGESSMGSFFDTSDLGVKSISFEDFCKEKNIEVSYDTVKSISKVLDFDVVNNVINFEKIQPPHKFTKKRSVINASDYFTEEDNLFLDSNLLGSSYQTIYTSLNGEIKKLVAKYIRYRSDIFDTAWQFINKLEDKSYYSIHIRRNDFQYKDLFITCEQILENIKQEIPEGSKLYIATDHKDKAFFEPLEKVYKVYYYDTVLSEINLYESFDVNWIPIIEQLICTRSIKFIGNSHSTLSSYIYRMRGYMQDIPNKLYYLNTEVFNERDQIQFVAENSFKGNWFREYWDSWSFNNGSIFVSIASYCDTQLIDTLKSLYSEAMNPEQVTVGVNLQDTEEAYIKLKEYNFPNLKIIYTPKEQAKGVVHARNRIKNELVGNQDYFLQIDSHSRFRQGWDIILINQYNSIEESKVILSTYPNHFDVPDYEKLYLNLSNNTPLRIKRFLQEVSLDDNRCIAENLPTLKDYEVVDTRWVAAGFLFTRKNWIDEVKIPDNIRFNGEEDFQTFLSYLKGWNIKVASLATVWHNYNYRDSNTDEPYREHNGKYFIEDNSIKLLNEYLFKQTHVRSLSELENYFSIKLKTV